MVREIIHSFHPRKEPFNTIALSSRCETPPRWKMGLDSPDCIFRSAVCLIGRREKAFRRRGNFSVSRARRNLPLQKHHASVNIGKRKYNFASYFQHLCSVNLQPSNVDRKTTVQCNEL